MSPATVIVYLIGLFILYILCRIFLKPLKWLARLFISCIAGCLAMIAINKLFGASFSVNPLTAMISGVLGLPGIVMTYFLQGLL